MIIVKYTDNLQDACDTAHGCHNIDKGHYNCNNILTRHDNCYIILTLVIILELTTDMIILTIY